jgi:hypothetical protein
MNRWSIRVYCLVGKEGTKKNSQKFLSLKGKVGIILDNFDFIALRVVMN